MNVHVLPKTTTMELANFVFYWFRILSHRTLEFETFYVNGLVWYFTLSPWLLSNFYFIFDLVSGLFVGRLFIHIDLLWK